MTDFWIILIVLAIVGAAAFYIWRSKKRGVKCIGCPYGGKCSGGCTGCSAFDCGIQEEQN